MIPGAGLKSSTPDLIAVNDALQIRIVRKPSEGSKDYRNIYLKRAIWLFVAV
jgi:hypothetical protein